MARFLPPSRRIDCFQNNVADNAVNVGEAAQLERSGWLVGFQCGSPEGAEPRSDSLASLGCRDCPEESVISEESDEIAGRSAASSYRISGTGSTAALPVAAEPVPGRRGWLWDQVIGYQVPGFRGTRALTMLTSVILSITESFCHDLAAEAAESSAHGVLEYLKAHLPGHHGARRPERGPAPARPDGGWTLRPSSSTYS